MKPTATFLLLCAAARLSAQTGGVAESVNVRVMDLDVVVTDRDGRPMPDLRRDEFRVRVDRKPVSIDYFASIQDSSVRPPDVTTLSPDLVLNPAERAKQAIVPRHFLVFFDANLTPSARQRAGQSLRSLVSRLEPSDEVLVIEEGGVRVRTLSPWTSNKEEIVRAIGEAEKPLPETVRRLERERQTLREIDIAGRVGAREERARMYEEEVFREAGRMVADLNEALSLFGGKAGKKIFFEVSGGFEMEPGAAVLAYAERSSVPTLSFRRDISADLQKLTDHANAMEVTIFTFDARGLLAPGIDASNDSSLATRSLAARDASQSGLAMMAEQTGGKAFLSQNRFDAAIEGVYREVSTYYSLGINLKNIPSENTHRIDVAVDRPGLLVRTRRTYTVESDEQRVESRVMATLLTDTSYADVSVSIKAAAPVRDKDVFVVPVQIEVPARDLTFIPDGDRASAHVAYYFSATNDRGDRSAISRTDQTLTIASNESGSARPMGVRVPVRLARGNYRIVVNVRDSESGRMGTARTIVKVE